jgi:hypothetical protein
MKMFSKCVFTKKCHHLKSISSLYLLSLALTAVIVQSAPSRFANVRAKKRFIATLAANARIGTSIRKFAQKPNATSLLAFIDALVVAPCLPF